MKSNQQRRDRRAARRVVFYQPREYVDGKPRYDGVQSFPESRQIKLSRGKPDDAPVELTGTSANSIEDAVNHAIGRAGESIRNLRWFEVIEMRGHIENQVVNHWQVAIKVGFTLET